MRFVRQGAPVDVSADYAIVATPSYVTHRIIRGLPRDTAEALASIPYGPFICGAFLTEESGPMPWDDIYAIAVVDKFFDMLVDPPTRSDSGQREPGGSLMVYAGGDRGRRLLPLSNDEIRALFLRDLHDVLPATRGIVREVLIQRWEHAIPYAPPGRAPIQAGLSRPLGRVFLAGEFLEFRRWKRRPPRVSRRPRRSAGGWARPDSERLRALGRTQAHVPRARPRRCRVSRSHRRWRRLGGAGAGALQVVDQIPPVLGECETRDPHRGAGNEALWVDEERIQSLARPDELARGAGVDHGG